MSNKKNDMKLYNALFPLWMLLLFPPLFFIIVLPGNFIIDSLFLIISMMALKVTDKKKWYKQYILPIFGFGLLADVIGSLYMYMLMVFFDVGRLGDELYLTIPAIIISAILIFVFNYFVTFRKVDKALRIKMALIFAIFTAPYTFLVPSSLLYS